MVPPSERPSTLELSPPAPSHPESSENHHPEAHPQPLTDTSPPPDSGLTIGRGKAEHTRRRLLAAAALLPLAGCLSAPSSSTPAYEAVEVDDGPVFEPGLASELDEAYYGALLLDDSVRSAFDRERVGAKADAFLANTDFEAQIIGLVQVAGVNSSTHFDVVDLALTQSGLTVVLALRDEPPYSEDRVISTLLVRVDRRPGPQPDGMWVDLGIGGRDVSFSGEVISSGT